MTATSTLSTLRNAAFALTGLILAAFAALVLFGDETALHHAVWAGAAGLTLFAALFVIGLVAGRRGSAMLWDEAAHADFARSQGWAYNGAVLVIFPVLAFAVVGGLAPIRAFAAAALLLGATQMLLFALFDARGR